jgi:hypothetical protein
MHGTCAFIVRRQRVTGSKYDQTHLIKLPPLFFSPNPRAGCSRLWTHCCLLLSNQGFSAAVPLDREEELAASALYHWAWTEERCCGGARRPLSSLGETSAVDMILASCLRMEMKKPWEITSAGGRWEINSTCRCHLCPSINACQTCTVQKHQIRGLYMSIYIDG